MWWEIQWMLLYGVVCREKIWYYKKTMILKKKTNSDYTAMLWISWDMYKAKAIWWNEDNLKNDGVLERELYG